MTTESRNVSELIGQRIMHRKSKMRGIVKSVADGKITVLFNDKVQTFLFPAAFADTLLLADELLQNKYQHSSVEASFSNFKKEYSNALTAEITYLRETGGKKHRIVDGERLPTNENSYIYTFETDSDLHFPDGTAIKLWLTDRIVSAQVISCEDFSIVIRSTESIGENIESIEFSAEQWHLLEALIERIKTLDTTSNTIAYMLACKGRNQIHEQNSIALGQDMALKRTAVQPITFIWGPPGTGKTSTLAKIASEFILKGKRVLMFSYSNVSVDGALLRVANMSDQDPGKILRYGYPRMKELLESETLTSYALALNKNPALAGEYKTLLNKRKRMKPDDAEKINIRKKMNQIRAKLLDQEKELIFNAAFLATTVSKAIADKTVYSQKFDVVIFDEASMAYVPQVIFAAGLAKERFCCLGDFRQLPAIVQNPADKVLTKDIFEFTGITEAVENNYSHEWLVMLNIQFRMHPEIASFVSRHMYGNRLHSADRIYEQRQEIAALEPISGESICMVDLSLTYSVCIKTRDESRINLMSAMFCINLAEHYAGRYDVGIITPYSAQSRLILAMLRDLQERNEKFKTVSCATVHQFQGSEKTIIIYDAVDCFRMPYPGMLLTSMKNDTANRLFNVALTRAKGKFILIANRDYLFRKNISKNLIFTRLLKEQERLKLSISGDAIFKELGTEEGDSPELFLGDRDEADSWERYLNDIQTASHEIYMSVPGVLDDDPEALKELEEYLFEAESRKHIKIYIRAAENISLPPGLKKYMHNHPWVTTPFTMIDYRIVWFGEPLSAADFISEGDILGTKYFPCLRFEGMHTAKMLKAIFDIPTLREPTEDGEDARES